jgi:hypothetical protein
VERKNVKYIVYYEFKPEDIDAVFAFTTGSDRKEHPERYPTWLFPFHATGQTTGFSIQEATPEQMSYNILKHTPLYKVKYVPIVDLPTLREQYQMMKQASTT